MKDNCTLNPLKYVVTFIGTNIYKQAQMCAEGLRRRASLNSYLSFLGCDEINVL